MTARRGSLHYKIVRLARPHSAARQQSRPWRAARVAAAIGGRVVLLFAALLVTGTVATQVWHAGTHSLQLHHQIVKVERANAALENANQKLATRTERLRDPEYLVPLIHEQLGLTKPREIFIEVTQTSAPQAP